MIENQEGDAIIALIYFPNSFFSLNVFDLDKISYRTYPTNIQGVPKDGNIFLRDTLVEKLVLDGPF